MDQYVIVWNCIGLDLHVDNCDRENSLLQLTGTVQIRSSARRVHVRETTSQRRIDRPRAAVRSITVVVRDRGEAADEADIKHDGQQREEGDSAQADGQQHGENAVQHRGAGHALDGLLPFWNVQVIMGEAGEEVGKAAQDEDGGEELDGAHDGLRDAEEGSTDRHGEGWCDRMEAY